MHLWSNSCCGYPRKWSKGAFLWDDPGLDQWSKITQLIVHQRNRWIRDQSGFKASSDASRPEWSWITDSDPDHPKGTHPNSPTLNESSNIPEVQSWEKADLHDDTTPLLHQLMNELPSNCSKHKRKTLSISTLWIIWLSTDRAGFNWAAKNQNQSNHSSQLQRPQTIQWTNHKGQRQSSEPIKTQMQSAGKRVPVGHD